MSSRWDKLRRYVGDAANRTWVRIMLSIWAIVGFYDTVLAQLVPESWAKQAPRVYELFSMTTGLLPWWAWGWIFTVIVAAAIIEAAMRGDRTKGQRSDSSSNSPDAASEMIPLVEAATELYEQFSGTILEDAAEGLSGETPNDIITWCVHYIDVRGGGVVGRRPPSRVLRSLPREFDNYVVRDGTIVALNRRGGEFVDLQIARSRLEEIKEHVLATHASDPPSPDQMDKKAASSLRDTARLVRTKLMHSGGGQPDADIAMAVRDSAYDVLARLHDRSDSSLQPLAEKLADAAHAYVGAAVEGNVTIRNRCFEDLHGIALDVLSATKWVEDQS